MDGRSRQTGTPQTRLRRRTIGFEAEGIRGLFEPGEAGAEGKGVLDPEIRGFIVNLKAEYLPMRDNEMATVCYVRFGERPHGRAARRVLETNPTAIRMFRRLKRHHEMVGVVERRLAIVTLRSEDRNTKSSAGWRITTSPGPVAGEDSPPTTASSSNTTSKLTDVRHGPEGPERLPPDPVQRVLGTSGGARLNHWKIYAEDFARR